MNFLLVLFPLVVLFQSCSSSPICECFEVRLEIKNMFEIAGADFKALEDITNSEKYKELKERKKECKDVTEPKWFESHNIKRNGRGDSQFLMEELGDCEAVRILCGEE